MLLTAWTAQQQGDDTAARQLFSQLASGKQNLSFLGLRGLISDALRHGKLERGLDLVKQAGERQPKTPWVLFTRLNLEARLNRWADAEDVIKAMQKKKLLDSATVGRLNAIIALQLSRQLKRDGHGSDALNYAREAFRLDNGFAPATLHYAHMIAEDGRLRRAAGILQKGWKAAPHPALGSAYIKLFADRSATDALKKVKALVRSNPEHPESLYLLARMQVRAKEYEAARATLLPLLEDETATRKVFQTMADIEEADNQGWQTVRQWMTKAEEAPLDATWVCNSCQQVCEDWQPLCPTCHSFGTLLWQRPGAQHLPALQMPNSPLDLSPEPFLPGRKAG